MRDHRLADRLISYWLKIKRDKELPPINLFNKDAISDLWGNCILLKLGKDSLYKIEYIGNNLLELFSKYNPNNINNKSNLNQKPLVTMLEKLTNLAATDSAKAFIEEGMFVTYKNKAIKYRSCLLPFGSSKNKVSHCIIAVNWKVL